MSDSLQPHGLYSPWNSPGQSTGVGNLSLLQGIFPTQGLNPGLPHYRQILYQPSHKGPGIEPGSPALQVDSLPTELSGKPLVPRPGIKPTPPALKGRSISTGRQGGPGPCVLSGSATGAPAVRVPQNFKEM